MKILRFCIAISLLVVSVPALALDTTTGSPLDLAPVLNPLIQVAGLILASCASAIGIFAVNWVRHRMSMSAIEVDAGIQAKIDAVAQKVVGGLVASVDVPAGKIMIDTHSVAINDAARQLASNLSDTLTQAGSTDNVAKAREIIISRLGMMQAAAEGTPIPNPSAPVPVAAPPQAPTVLDPTLAKV